MIANAETSRTRAPTTRPTTSSTSATSTSTRARPVQKVVGVIHSKQLHHDDETSALQASQKHKTTTATMMPPMTPTPTPTEAAKDEDESVSAKQEIDSKSDSQSKPPPRELPSTKIRHPEKCDELDKLTAAENLTRAWVLNEGMVVHGESWTSRVRQPYDRDVIVDRRDERRDVFNRRDDRRPEHYRRRYDDAAIRTWTFKNRRSSVDKAMDFWTCLFCCCS